MSAYAPVFRNRPDTFFGVCEAVGQDFGFNANYLRLIFCVSVLASPFAVVGAYIALGVVVAVSRLVAPNMSSTRQAEAAVRPEAVNDAEQGLAVAA